MTDRTRPNPSCQECQGDGQLLGHERDCLTPGCGQAFIGARCLGVLYSCECWNDPNACAGCGEPAPVNAKDRGWLSVIFHHVDGRSWMRLRCLECQEEG